MGPVEVAGLVKVKPCFFWGCGNKINRLVVSKHLVVISPHLQGGPPTSYNLGYNLIIRPFIGVITPFIDGRGPPCGDMIQFDWWYFSNGLVQPPAIQAIPPKKFHLVPFASLSWSIFCPCDATRGVIGILRHDDHIFGKAGWKIPYPPRISSFTPSFLLVFIDAIWFGCITATVLVQLELVGQTTRI